jgi:dipeptidyl aminopeptidase/acylaminoacyl peptidase
MLRWLTCSLVCGLLAGPAVGGTTHPLTVRDMLAMGRISDARVSPDGKRVLYAVAVPSLEKNRNVTSIHLAATDGSWDRRFTGAEGGSSQARWSPAEPGLVYFVSSRSGSSQVWRLPLDGGEAEQVTHLPLDVDALEVARDGRSLLLSMAVLPGRTPEETQAAQEEQGKSKASGMVFDRLFVRHWDTWADGTRNHVFVYDLASGKARDLMPRMDADCPTRPFGGSEDYALSPDGRTVVFSAKEVAERSSESWSTNFDLFSVPLDGSAAPVRLTTNPAWDAQPRFSPDGKTLAYLAMSRPGFEADRFDVVLRDLATGAERRFVLKADDTPRGDRSADGLAWSPDGRTLYCMAENVGQKALFAVDPATGKARILVGQGTVTEFQVQAGGRILYGMNSLKGPTELYTVDAEGRDVRRLTHANDAHLADVRLGEPEAFSFKGAKGDTVHGYLVRPVDFDPARKYPVAFLIHGGPQGVFGNDWHYRWNPQAYAGAGYAVVMVDFHGSTSYGQAFTDAIRDDWGGAPFEDLMKGLDFALGHYAFLDKDRCAALGASYGGFMINWIAGHTDRFRTLVCHDGNLDERMAYYDTEELWFPEWEHKGLPWENPASYTRQNPIEFVKNWKTPMLVIHGMKDFRIAYSQGLSTFTALQRKGIPSKLLMFPDENHWVVKPANSLQWHETVLGWLDQWLKK